MKKSLVALSLLTLLAGCGGGDDAPTTPPPGPDIPEPEIPQTLAASLSLNGNLVLGSSVSCNGQSASNFEIKVGDDVSCEYQSTTLASFSDVQPDAAAREATPTQRKTLYLTKANEFVDNSQAANNAVTLINTMGVTRGDIVELELNTLQALKFENHYRHDLDMSTEEFAGLLEQQANDSQTDKQPSTHVPDIKPEVTPGASPDLNAGFVAADAESNYQYQPKETIPTIAVLTDSQSKPVSGVSYFSRSGRGVTNDQGEFEFFWGDSVSFGIDTFELGTVRGNQQSFTLQQLAEGDKGNNAEALIKRYASEEAGHWQLPTQVTQVFAQYPNVINEIISLSLTSEARELDLGNGTTQVIPAEFTAQFKQGQAAIIDQQLCQNQCDDTGALLRQASVKQQSTDESGQILADIQKLWGSSLEAQANGWKPVEHFHVFHDSTNFYGSTGNARGQAAVNIANTAFPVVMSRNDNNYWLPFGAKKAWDKDTLAYITEAPSTVVPELVGGETATFNLPFISIGEIGQGKVMVMGNARYNSVLVCPNGFSWHGGIDDAGQCRLNSDSNDMKYFFQNSFKYLTDKDSGFTVGTNIPHVYFKRHGQVAGEQENFVIADTFGVTTEQVSSFAGLDPQTMPLLIINGFGYLIDPNGNHYDLPMRADLSRPKLSQDDATALIDYVSKGGNIMLMETIQNTLDAGAVSRLLDSAGIAFGMGGSVVANGNGHVNGHPGKARSQRGEGIWVIERYAAVEGDDGTPALPYRIDENGKVVWLYQEQNKPDDKPQLELAHWTESGEDGQPVNHPAFIDEAGKTDAEIQAEKTRVLAAFTKADGTPAYAECKDPNYHYEINCLEYRPGNGIPVTGGMFVPRYTELDLGDAQARAMVKAADLGTNIERLYQHELYFRTKGKQGERLSSVDLNRIYQNMSVWLWNNLDYRYESGANDELGFKRFTEFLNCYSDDRAQGGTSCPADLKQQLLSNQMILGEDQGQYAGYMNPSYPLNYMEKPLTRLMLGRTFWDLDIKTDIRQFPGEATGTVGSDEFTLTLGSNTAAWFAGNRQPTGQWAVAHQPFTVSVKGTQAPVTITVALADDLTGREKHELGLKRPPRMTQSVTLNSDTIGNTHTMTVPYGGLIYVQGSAKDMVQVSLTDTVDAPLYQLSSGRWLNPVDSPAPIGEVVSNSFIYTAPKANLNADNYDGVIARFAAELDTFADDLNDFYARDEGLNGQANRKATDISIPANRHHFVNDVAISIGAAHSGYPVMNSGFNTESRNIQLAPLNSWLLWHEVGHNAAEAPFNVEGATEVVNNLLALYMQDKHHGKMSRVEQDIRIAPDFVAAEQGHAWAMGGAGERLVMFAQLKEWAETEFDIKTWYPGKLPAYYDETQGVQGWNLFKLMHRLSRNADDGEFELIGDNMCYGQNLGQSDKLMLCASYAAQTDLSQFFQDWNPGSKAVIYPGDPQPQFEGGVTDAGVAKVRALGLPKPKLDPASIDSITVIVR
ncbi:SslE/AcfD family lipoprotein zinc metalloprotease [Shewanella submarina]|uniref:SslE/AcfD family lipoprotein zinc metalloprotease n=1 Tax=Shewanella submarina TaxID=2016376 RepID=A0ABV7GG94_9GAMM|nr:SslE/AcfD family lipoprotein zinc metalloprotease [Shewanella submarina]MCL1039860.1 SslE/AcfD family lipoprotein zinc metalloprotease [Shewanella submarina]